MARPRSRLFAPSGSNGAVAAETLEWAGFLDRAVRVRAVLLQSPPVPGTSATERGSQVRRQTTALAPILVVLLCGGGAGAQTFVPAGTPVSRYACTIAPLSEAEVAAAQHRAAIATPAVGDNRPVEDVPTGTPADDETAAAVTAVEMEYAACYNAGEMRRMLALLADPLLALVSTYAADPEIGRRFATPEPMPKDDQIEKVVLLDPVVLPDGRVGALVVWNGLETNFHLFQKVDGAWKLQDEISVSGEFIVDQ